MQDLKLDTDRYNAIRSLPPGAKQVEGAAEMRARLNDSLEVTIRDGVRDWVGSGHIIPPHIFQDAALVCPIEQAKAYHAYLMDSISDYWKRHPAGRHQAIPVSANAG